jgi:hypothetical protein
MTENLWNVNYLLRIVIIQTTKKLPSEEESFSYFEK